MDIRKVTERLSVSPQITENDLAAIKSLGFKTILCNRPDGEEGEMQPKIIDLKSGAEDLGLTFLALPFAGAPSPEVIEQQGQMIAAADAPVLAFCRSGTRSITAWALSQAGQGRGPEIIEAAAEAGYDLSGLAAHL
ncbi:MAG: TIGR01244 family sulfur transferase [Pseudomonadota bacterium]